MLGLCKEVNLIASCWQNACAGSQLQLQLGCWQGAQCQAPCMSTQVERMVTGIAAGLRVPLTAKIRIFPELARTLEYARMLERCGVQLLAVHGRTRDQKDSRAHKADWDAIKVS